MLNIKVQPASVEENFVFGSPPLLNGFVYNSCRSETRLNPHVNHESFSYNNQRYDASDVSVDNPPTSNMAVSPAADLKRKPFIQQQKFPIISYNRNYFQSQQQQQQNGCRTSELMVENLSQLNLGSHVDKGIKLLEQVCYKVHQPTSPSSPELTFKKRKDLRVLKLALSNERFRDVAVKFGDGDEGGREISESVHRTLRQAKTSQVSCVNCKTNCQVYENFPIVDGTLFLTPVPRFTQCIRFVEKTPSTSKVERFLSFICVGCMEGKMLTCSSCSKAWNGSFFQVGTMYSYDILSATPCCERAVACNKCSKPVIDMSKGEAHNLYFSNFSAKTTCPHCSEEDFHFIKPLSQMTPLDAP